MSAEIAATRGVAEGRDCISPSRHAEFSDCDSLLDWVELLAAETGLPVGIKSAVGDMGFWDELTGLGGNHFQTTPHASSAEGGIGLAPTQVLVNFLDNHDLPRFMFEKTDWAIQRVGALNVSQITV